MPGMFGGGGSGMADAAQQAGAIQAQSAQRAADQQWQMFQQAQGNLQPWLQSGQAANTQQAGLLGLPGYTAQDPTATLQKTPGYQWLLGQGTQSRDLAAASKGLALSGSQQKGLTDFGQNLAQTYAWNPYMQNLQNMSGQGMQAGGQIGNWGMQTGQQMGQDYMAGGQAQAQGIWNAAKANQQQQQSQGSGWGSLLGMGLGIAAAPFTGGTSLIGSGLSALGGLGNWFGGGGSGGGGASSYNIGGNNDSFFNQMYSGGGY